MAFCVLMRENAAEAAPALRQQPRVGARAGHREGVVHQVMVHALSPDGVIVEARDSLPEGTRVVFEIAEIGHCPATILWRDGSLYDCQFDRRLDPLKVHRKLLRTKVVWGPFGTGSDELWSGGTAPCGLIGTDFPEPGIDPWSGRIRMLLLIVGGVLCWLPPIALLLGWRP
ncbi:hypothetical protein HL653_07140 [Sphingomonas sp. AP4-R1]|uniref:hypothetical protein n=1 Tax=Sphingomonas sp. AP4-R1 TaxID=2735134 RepID=UPI0014934849|nr:hypothetical protein [Sphingomonas sp. AP4-R1]QJU57592.1 hypothetical protein HL653_07140 [Sphingomonas sp. AP4-R1]